jgi:hypothetical protein
MHLEPHPQRNDQKLQADNRFHRRRLILRNCHHKTHIPVRRYNIHQSFEMRDSNRCIYSAQNLHWKTQKWSMASNWLVPFHIGIDFPHIAGKLRNCSSEVLGYEYLLGT